MKDLTLKENEISKLSLWEISTILELEESPDISPMDLVPETEENKMKIMCLQLSNDYNIYKELYTQTDVYEVFEMMALQNAIQYRPPKEETQWHH